jgi:hypothetical protein
MSAPLVPCGPVAPPPADGRVVRKGMMQTLCHAPRSRGRAERQCAGGRSTRGHRGGERPAPPGVVPAAALHPPGRARDGARGRLRGGRPPTCAAATRWRGRCYATARRERARVRPPAAVPVPSRGSAACRSPPHPIRRTIPLPTTALRRQWLRCARHARTNRCRGASRRTLVGSTTTARATAWLPSARVVRVVRGVRPPVVLGPAHRQIDEL